MDLLGAGIWDALAQAGGSVALTFIFALLLGVVALTLLFLGSSVIVLERFARSARGGWALFGVATVWAVAVGGLALDFTQPELALAPWSERGWVWLGASALSLVGIGLFMALVWLALRWLGGRRVAILSLLALGIGYGLMVGGSRNLGYAIGPPLAAGLVLVALYGLRRWRRPGEAPSEGEGLLRWLTPALAVGLFPAFLLTAPDPQLSLGGILVLAAFGAFVGLGLLPLAAVGLIATRGTVEWFIALRYLVARRRQTFISLITLICITGVASGVWLIIVVLSVMNGFERVWREEIIGNRAHFTVQSGLGPFEDYDEVLKQVLAFENVVGASPFLDTEGMVRGSAGEIVGVRIRGVDPTTVGQVTDLESDLVAGSLEALLQAEPGADPGIIVGSQLAGGIGLGVGDTVTLISPFGGPPTPFGPAPRLKSFQVAGIFKSSFFQYDEVFTYVNLPAAQDFRRSGDVVQGIEVRATDIYRSGALADAVQMSLGFPYYTRDWKEFFPSFFQALKTERVMMFVLLTMIMVVAAFVIIATLIMMIMEKSSDIAILKAMGARDAVVERVFAIEGTLIGLAGTTLGVIAGVLVLTRLDWVQLWVEDLTGIDALPASVYQFSTLPWEIDLLQIVVVSAIAMILALGATLFPSRQGARLDPAEALRYE